MSLETGGCVKGENRCRMLPRSMNKIASKTRFGLFTLLMRTNMEQDLNCLKRAMSFNSMEEKTCNGIFNLLTSEMEAAM
jgi:hypothetical protein